MSDKINLVSYERAEKALRFGYPDGNVGHRTGHRWGGNPAVSFLNDFDALQQTLFAEQNKTAVKHLNDRKADLDAAIPSTKLGNLKELWDTLFRPTVNWNFEKLQFVWSPSAKVACHILDSR